MEVSDRVAEVFAATFNTHVSELPNFPFTKADPLIVERRNPVEPHAVVEPTI